MNPEEFPEYVDKWGVLHRQPTPDEIFESDRTTFQIQHIENHQSAFNRLVGYRQDVAEYFWRHRHQLPDLYFSLCHELNIRPIHREREYVEREYMDKYGNFLSKDDWKPHDLPIKGTTVLSCGCGVPWAKHHQRDTSVLLCDEHGVVTIQEFR